MPQPTDIIGEIRFSPYPPYPLWPELSYREREFSGCPRCPFSKCRVQQSSQGAQQSERKHKAHSPNDRDDSPGFLEEIEARLAEILQRRSDS